MQVEVKEPCVEHGVEEGEPSRVWSRLRIRVNIHEGAALSKSSTSISFVFSSGVGGVENCFNPYPLREGKQDSHPLKSIGLWC